MENERSIRSINWPGSVAIQIYTFYGIWHSKRLFGMGLSSVFCLNHEMINLMCFQFVKKAVKTDYVARFNMNRDYYSLRHGARPVVDIYIYIYTYIHTYKTSPTNHTAGVGVEGGGGGWRVGVGVEGGLGVCVCVCVGGGGWGGGGGGGWGGGGGGGGWVGGGGGPYIRGRFIYSFIIYLFIYSFIHSGNGSWNNAEISINWTIQNSFWCNLEQKTFLLSRKWSW